MTESFQFRATLLGHNGWVTQIAIHPKDPEIIISASRDKTIIVWKLTHDEASNYAYPQKRLYGHSHFISDIALSSDGNYALSGSWDQTLRLWDIVAGKTLRLFEDHAKEVLTVAFSADDRQIVSGSRDKTIKLWNTLAECKFTIQDGHTDWVSCVRFAPNPSIPILVSCSWDQTVRVWNLANCQMMKNHHGHNDYLNTVSVSPDGSLCSSGGNDAMALLWDLNGGTNFCTLEHNDTINALCFSPTRYWLSVAYGPSIRIWDLARKEPVKELGPDILSAGAATADLPHCLSLAWSTDGLTLFAGYSDNTIRVWQMLVSDH